MIKSSRYPKIGMKSGMKSIGDNAYATVNTANSFAYQGVFLSFNARNTAGTSFFNCFTFSFMDITIRKFLVKFLFFGEFIISYITPFFNSKRSSSRAPFLHPLYISFINHRIAFSCHSDFGCIANPLSLNRNFISEYFDTRSFFVLKYC